MTTIARKQTLHPVTLLAGNLAAWMPLAVALALFTRAADPLRSAVIYIGLGIPVIVVVTLLAERPLLTRLRKRSEGVVEWTAIAASGAGLALPGALVFAVIGLASDPSWAVISAAVGAVACGFAGTFVGLVGRALYRPLSYVRPVSWVILGASVALLLAAAVILAGVLSSSLPPGMASTIARVE